MHETGKNDDDNAEYHQMPINDNGANHNPFGSGGGHIVTEDDLIRREIREALDNM